VPNIGVLSLQGDFFEHIKMLESIGASTVQIRTPEQLDTIDGLIIPGGESTTITQLIDLYDFRKIIQNKASEGLAVWGTCAGMIVIAKNLTDLRPKPLNLIDIEVSRNAFGRQKDSFETYLNITGIDQGPFRSVFIRAPLVTKTGKTVEVLATIKKLPVAVKEANILCTSFHPELTDDNRIHKFFANMCINQ